MTKQLKELSKQAVLTKELTTSDVTLYDLEKFYRIGFTEAVNLIEEKAAEGLTLQQILWELQMVIDKNNV